MSSIINILNKYPYRKIVWLLAITETLHNIEEAIWLPGWSKSAGMWHPPVNPFEFRFAVAAITLLIYGIIYYFSKKYSNISKYLMAGSLAIILFNVLMPHLLATIITGRYTPGVVTGLLFNVPATLYLLQRGIRESIYNTRTLVYGSVAFAIISYPLLSILFIIGNYVGKLL